MRAHSCAISPRRACAAGPLAVAIASLGLSALGCNAILDIEDRPLRPSSPYRDAVIADQPILYLRFGESGGATAHDEMNHFSGTYPASAATLGYPGAIGDDTNTAVLLDGTEGIAMPPGVDFSTLQPFTVEVWVKPAGPPAAGVGFVVDHETFSPQRAGWDVAASSKTLFERWAGAGNGLSATGPAVTQGQWHYVVGTFEGSPSRMVLWIDGESAASVVGAPAVPAIPQGWTIGAQNCDCRGNNFTGAIDELAIYGAVLPDARIRAHFAAASP